MRVIGILAFAIIGLCSACVIVISDDGRAHGNADDTGDHSTVNRSIRIDAGRSVGDLDSVNGSIEIGDHVRAESVETVNGSIRIGGGVSIGRLEAVNGAIESGPRLQIRDGIETINGSITLDEGSVVGGDIETVNGHIRLNRTRVGGMIDTIWSDIDTGRDSVIGSILVERPGGRSGRQKPPKVVIGPGTVVEGPMRFEHPVRLSVHETAQIHEVIGAEVTWFSGDTP